MSERIIKLRSEMRVGIPTPAGFVYTEGVLRQIAKDVNKAVQGGKPIVGKVLSRKDVRANLDDITHDVVGAEYSNGRIIFSIKFLDNERAHIVEQLCEDLVFVPKLIVLGNHYVDRIMNMKVRVITGYDQLARIDIGPEG